MTQQSIQIVLQIVLIAIGIYLAFFSGLFGSDGGAGEVSDNPYLKHQLIDAKVSLLLLSLNYEKVKCLTC
ncbi:MAG: hypothetical protein ACKVU0_09025 [Saprospiraceae bacterium]